MTLQEYYESKGVDVNQINKRQDPVKKTEVNADWIKKEKLTVLETKEDKKRETRNKVQVPKNELQPGQSVAEDNKAELLGFHSKQSAKRPERNRDEKEERPRDNNKKPVAGGGKKKEKIVINEDEFPTL